MARTMPKQRKGRTGDEGRPLAATIRPGFGDEGLPLKRGGKGKGDEGLPLKRGKRKGK